MILSEPDFHHTPVLLKEVVEALGIQSGGRYIDCTVGEGGHSEAILRASSPGGQLLGIDADPDAIRAAEKRLQAYEGSYLLVNDNFSTLERIASEYNFKPVHGVLFDLGLSSLQLEAKGRGFSFRHDEPLDMRFGPGQGPTAEQIVNTYSQDKLASIFREYGEERRGRQIARRIVESRPIRTSLELAKAVEKAVGGVRGRIHPATKVFMSLRIAVNQELANLEEVLPQALRLLGYEGRLVIISYHSLEDRIIKAFIKRESQDCICPPKTPVCICGHKATLRPITKKAIFPSESERLANPRSRSARMRVAEHV